MKDRIGLLPLLVPVLALTAACSTSYVSKPTQSADVPTLPPGAVNAALASTQPLEPNTGVVQAPLCSASASCAALDGEQIQMGCVKKIPYTNVLVPQGTTFEVVDKSGDFSCIDSGVVVGDKEVLSCHGKELYAFQLKLSNAACTGAGLATGTGQCQDGYGYDAAANCCAPVGPESAGTTTVTIDLGACP